MLRNDSNHMRHALLSFGAIAVMTLSCIGTDAHAQTRRQQREDARTCAQFGTSYGTRGYTQCMLEQQRRRDDKERETLEKMALTSQIAKDGQIMAERARRQRCDRDPDRRECRR
jgi:hypothetical protein